jgi:hypothetical protein
VPTTTGASVAWGRAESKLINDLQCGSGRSGSSRHVKQIISEVRKKVGESFAVFSAEL